MKRVFCLVCFAKEIICRADFRAEKKEIGVGAFHTDPASVSLRLLCLQKSEQMQEYKLH